MEQIIRSGYKAVALTTLLASVLISGFVGYAHPAEAAGLGSQIVCMVFSDLNQVGTPIPFLDAEGCPDGATPLPMCSDTLDNDGDGLTDFPSDPGCTDATDTTESPNPVTEPPVLPGACLDGIDNDGDGLVDWSALEELGDPGCDSPLDTDESNSPPPPPPPAQPTLTVIKVVVNNNGGTGTVADFPLSVGSVASSTNTPVVSGATTTFAAGAYIVSELTNSAYTATFSGDCDASGNITLATGDVKTCIITNDDVAPTPPGGGGGSGGGGGDGGGTGSSGGGGGIGGGIVTLGQVLGVATAVEESRICDPYIKTFIKFGARNDVGDVERLQSFLNEFEGATLAVTGTYTQETVTAVRAFQNKYLGEVLVPWGINASTGYVYLTTRKKINEIHCNSTFPLSPDEQRVIERARGQVTGVRTAQSEVSALPTTPAVRAEAVVPTKNTEETPETEATSARASLMDRITNFFSRLIGRNR